MTAYLPGMEKAIEAVKAQKEQPGPSMAELQTMRNFFEGSMRRNHYSSDIERKQSLAMIDTYAKMSDAELNGMEQCAVEHISFLKMFLYNEDFDRNSQWHNERMIRDRKWNAMTGATSGPSIWFRHYIGISQALLKTSNKKGKSEDEIWKEIMLNVAEARKKFIDYLRSDTPVDKFEKGWLHPGDFWLPNERIPQFHPC